MTTKTNTPNRNPAKKQTFNWLVDAGLLAGFLLTFFLNLTGLALHQLLGVFIAAAALYHLFLHFDWVKAVTKRLFDGNPSRKQLYYTFDAAILLGLAAITLTGLVISTWLNLTLENYAAWRTVHVFSSVATLLAVVVKIFMHRRWIVTTLLKAVSPLSDAGNPMHTPAPQSANTGAISRRAFLSLMGTVGLGTTLAISNVFIQTAEASSTETSVAATLANPQVSSAPIENTPAAVSAVSTTTVQSAAVTSTVESTQATPTETQAAVAVAVACSARCPRGKHCSFPGQCGRYTDQNNNSRCDLGECA